MPEIRHRQDKPSPEIEYAEIHIPDDRHLGTGSFTTVTKPSALSTGKAVSSIMFNPPSFQISLNLNPSTGEIPVLLGAANGSDPISRKVFLFQEQVGRADSHEFKVTFEDWQITGLYMDGTLLPEMPEGLLPPGAPIPEHEGTLILTVPAHYFPQELQNRILDDIFDLSKYFTFYQVQQGNTEINIFRNTDFQFVYRHYNPTFEREIRIDFADAERQGARAFYLVASWSAVKDSFSVGLIHSDPKFEPLRSGLALTEDKLRLIKDSIEEFEEIVNTPGKEEEAHQFLKNNGLILDLTSMTEPISKFKLGDDYVTDFVLQETPTSYVFVEIEKPQIRFFLKSRGNRPPERTQPLNHAIEQLENWKAWIAKYPNYISDKLPGVSPNPLFWLIAGRRINLSDREKTRLAEINQEYKGSYKIFTYDDLIDRVKAIISKLS
jgi:hypothetical protein